MMISELLKEYDSSFDDYEDGRVNPGDDNYGKIFQSNTRKPFISLRHINELKKMKAAKQEEFKSRQQLMNAMYGVASEEEPL